jgi:tyrosine-protein phosphatase SIW14
VIDLRGPEHSEADEKRIVEANGMRYVGIPMKGMRTPPDEQISEALKLMNDPNAGPVFVHCRRGADRTGAVIACYRIDHDRWDSAKALEEASRYGMRWFEIALRKYVARFATNASEKRLD